MILINVFNSFFGIWHAFVAKIQPPFFVSQILVPFGEGFPFDMCTWIGSLFSFAQK